MPRHPTPITEELDRLGASLAALAAAECFIGVPELRDVAEQLAALARRTVPLERFHAELVAEAAEEELRQASGACDFAGQFGNPSR